MTAFADASSFSTDLFSDNRYVELVSIFDPTQVRLRDLTGTERVGEPFSYQVRMISREPIENLGHVVGTRMAVGLKLRDGSARYFGGIVTSFRFVGIDETRRTNYVAEVRSWLELLHYRQNCRVFQDRTALEVIKAVFADHPAARFRDTTRGEGVRVRPLCVQWNETDLAFVSRLMEQEGIYYYFEHTHDEHELVLVDNAAAHRPCPVDETIETHLNLERAQIHNDMIYRWEEVATLQPDLVTLDDYDYEKAKTSLTAIEPIPGAQGSPGGDAKLEHYHWPGDHRTIGDGRTYARIRAQEFACRRSRFWLDTNARNMVPGHMFTAANPFDRTDLVRDPTQEKRYLLLGGEFSIVGETGLERKASEPHFLFSGRMEALPAATQFRPPPHTPRPVIGGVQTAVVVGTPGQDIGTNRYGCVRVQFLWDREGRKDERSSCFLRVAQSWAGRGWGGLVTPRIGQEVVVQFVNGDPDWPLITGALYNSSNMPPYDLPSQATRSTFRSRSSPGLAEQYNELRFEDRAGSEEVYLRAQKDLNGDAMNNMTLKAGNRADITARLGVHAEAAPFPGSPLGSSIELDSEGLLTATCSLNIMLKVGPAGVPLASILINEAGITLVGPTINLVSESGEINMSGPPIFPPV